MKQLAVTVDERTTVICLDAAGQLRMPDEPFNTLNGDFMHPPFHIHCRTLVMPYLPGFIDVQRREANAELMKRPLAERKKGPGGVGARRIPVPDGQRAVGRNPATPKIVPAGTPATPPVKATAAPSAPATPADRGAAFLAAFEDGYTVLEQLSGGNAAVSVQKIRLSDGQIGVLKKGSEDETEREHKAGVIARAVGLDYIAERVSATEILTEFVEGRAGIEYTAAAVAAADTAGLVKNALWAAEDAASNAELDRVAGFPQGKLVGLLDWLIHNSDRHVLNWIATPKLDDRGTPLGDPEIAPIDHGHAQFVPAEPFIPNSPFAYWILGLPFGKAYPLLGIAEKVTPRVTAAEVAELRAALEAVEGEFADRPSWFEHILDKLRVLEATAK
jgi:hypothetical protein